MVEKPNKPLWEDLQPTNPSDIPHKTIKERLQQAQVSIAESIYKQGYISREEANVGATLGLGFCPQTGGPIEE